MSGNDSDAQPTEGRLFPLKPAAAAFEVKDPIEYNKEGYPLPEKVHTLSPEIHQNENDAKSTYLYPRSTFYLQTGDEEPAADAKKEKPKGLFPLKPKAKEHEVPKGKEVKFSKEGYPDVEKVHTLSPELHQEYSNQDSTFLFPRTAFYV